MASMITSAVVATEFNLDTEMANLMVGIGIPLSLVTVPLWNYFLFN
jgi:predicted permease